MTTAQSPLSRQPEKLDYASPTQFRFGINQLPKVEFFTVGANLPGISADAEFRTFRDVTSNSPAGGTTPATDIVGGTVPDKALYSDAFLMILSNKNNPIVEVVFENIFPISLSALDFTQSATDVEYMTASAEFAYQIYDIKSL